MTTRPRRVAAWRRRARVACSVVMVVSVSSCERSAPTPVAVAEPRVAPRPAESAPAPRLAYRVESTSTHGDCEGGATHVFVGMDTNANATLEASEQQPVPMTFCRVERADVELVDVPPNAYCPRPGAVAMIRFATDPPDERAEIVVCFSPSRREIEATYAVYDPR